MSKANPIISLQLTTHRNYINAVVIREHGSRHHSSITQSSRLRLASAQQRIIEATAPDELKPYSFCYEYGTKRVARWTTGALMDDPAVVIEPETTTELRQAITTELEAAEHPGVPMCAVPDCLDGTKPGYVYCAAHLDRWTLEETIQREG